MESPDRCPQCGSTHVMDDIMAEDVPRWQGNRVIIRNQCAECGYRWRERYQYEDMATGWEEEEAWAS